MERYVLIDKYCGWPKLSMMQDGALIMGVYNKPNHGGMGGEAEVWRSDDGGRSFSFLGYPFEPVPGVGQNNECLGVAHNGDIIEGIIDYTRKGRGPKFSRSSDGGKTFRVTCESLDVSCVPGDSFIAMYGQIVQVPDGKTLALAFWTRDPEGDCRAYICFSDDDGYTWDRMYPIGLGPDDLLNETAIHFFDKDHAIAVCRSYVYGLFQKKDKEGNVIPTPAPDRYYDNECLRQYRTRDGGKTWKYEGTITGAQCHPANLTALQDGSLLLTYGCRWKPFSFICVQTSSTQGMSWEAPQVLAMYESCDGGYPSSIQNPDGTVCTVYYVQAARYHTGYHVASVVWHPDELIGDSMVRVNGLGTPSFVRQGTSLHNGKPEDVIHSPWQFMI